MFEVINYGADLKAQNKWGRTALDTARRTGYHNIEQLILFSQLNATIGNDIKNTAENIHKQNGIIDNICSELKEIGLQSKDLFEKILMELMINIINKRLSFDYDYYNLLNSCSNIVYKDNEDPLISDLCTDNFLSIKLSTNHCNLEHAYYHYLNNNLHQLIYNVS